VPAGSFPQAAPYDGTGANGLPYHNRAPLNDQERAQVLTYLESAPIVLAARGFDNDPFAPADPADVPMAFATDGSWVWASAVPYYLRKHGVPPEPAFLAHIRGRGYAVPEVAPPVRQQAVDAIMSGG
jgi:hypothetical protein